MTTMTITTTVDLTTMSDETLDKQIQSNRENAKKATDAINNHLLGERVIPGDPNAYRGWAESANVADLSVGDLIAVTEVSGTRYSRSVSAGEDVTNRLLRGYGGWSLYVVAGKTAKQVKVRSVALPNGYYDDPYSQGNGYADWPANDGGYTRSWGDKSDRFIFPVGTLAEAQERLAQVGHRVERFQRTYDARQSLIAEVARRKAIKDAERDAKRAPRKEAVARVNKIAGITLLTFSGYDWCNDEGTIEWSYEMRGQSFSKEPSRFVMALAAQTLGLRRLASSISAEDYAFVLDAVKDLPGGKEFASSIDVLTDEDDGTQDDDEDEV